MKTAIVTGASGNLGRAIAQKFMDEGIRVIGTISPRNKPPFTAGKTFMYAALDLANETETEGFVRRMIKEYETIDYAVFTVGGFAMNKISETSIGDIRQQFSLNFETTYILARLIFIQMLKQGHGRIFLTGARTGTDMKLSKGFTAYGLAKSLIFRLAELMNEEAKGTDVITAVIAPSVIDTPANRSAMPDADFSKWVQPGDIAEVVYQYCQPGMNVLREPVLKVYHKA
jgi:NAD(P)-dependent dehydrogenase (short-subunit alcohol dehydrogenase family)